MNKDVVINEAEKLASKFISKVETGRARSTETYLDCKNLIKLINELKTDDQ